jgi:ACT domain-containing protein
MAKKDRASERFTDLSMGYSIDPEDKRTDEEVTKDMKKLGIKITRVSEKPPEAY